MAPVIIRAIAACAVLAAGAAARGRHRPRVDVVGRATRLCVHDGEDLQRNATWVVLEFGKVQEIDAQGRAVNQHYIRNLSDEQPTIIQKDVTMYGVSATQVTMTVNLNFDTASCDGASADAPAGAGSVTIKTLVFNADTDIPYDTYTVPIQQGQMKYDIEAENWPFCAAENKLTFDLCLKTPSDTTGRRPRHGRGMQRRMHQTGLGNQAQYREDHRPRSQLFKADAGGGSGVTMDLPEVVLADGRACPMGVSMADGSDGSHFRFTFPHFHNRMVYDPAVGFEDESNTIVSGGGRAAMWGALVVVAALSSVQLLH